MSESKASFSFDIMDAAGYGYYRVWKERAYLLKLASIPLFIKFACTIAIISLGYEENILRQGLVMLPATFAQGWVLAQFLRTLLMNERWPVSLAEVPDERLIGKLLERARGIIASVLIYVLLGMLAYILRYALFEIMPSEDEVENARAAMKEAETSESLEDLGGESVLGLLTLIPTIAGIAAMIWAFRFMWLYIPFAVLMPFRSYMKALGGFMPSVRLLVLFFSCMAPITFVAIMLARIAYGVTEDMGETGEMLGNFVTVFISVLSEVFVALVTTASFAWAMKPFLPQAKDVLNDLPKGD